MPTLQEGPAETAEAEVLAALDTIIDPDFGTSIVACGFVKDLVADAAVGRVSFRLELTTPACPVKDEFERKARHVQGACNWASRSLRCLRHCC